MKESPRGSVSPGSIFAARAGHGPRRLNRVDRDIPFRFHAELDVMTEKTLFAFGKPK